MRGGAPARDYTGAEVAPGVPLHAGWGRGWGRVRVIRPCVVPTIFIPQTTEFLRAPQMAGKTVSRAW